ncbi:hypothetical protein MHA01_29630 [Marinococcus halophilus]|uniref:Uncharacterized protein n=1 Tax=Marinococcus halophilus TaxID=1371 RepID=A0A510Y9N6_MARHA|nr:hypothetical protein MHA01_29630 [Marinococcus halophilus]
MEASVSLFQKHAVPSIRATGAESKDAAEERKAKTEWTLGTLRKAVVSSDTCG